MIFSRSKIKSGGLNSEERSTPGGTFERWRNISQRLGGGFQDEKENSFSFGDFDERPWTVAESTIALREDSVIENQVPFIPTASSPYGASSSEATDNTTLQAVPLIKKDALHNNIAASPKTALGSQPASSAPPPPQGVNPQPLSASNTKVPPSDLSLPVQEDIKRRFGSNVRSALGPGTVIEGTFRFDTPVCIDGTLTGEVFSSSVLIAGSQASVNARVKVGSLVILGHVVGDIEANDLIEIRAGGNLQGDISAHRIVIEDGGVFNGLCTIID